MEYESTLKERNSYKWPEQEYVNTVVSIRLYCDNKNCCKYIKGFLGYNGNFTAEGGEHADLRNKVWNCKEHYKGK